jgi:hypothetical protein
MALDPALLIGPSPGVEAADGNLCRDGLGVATSPLDLAGLNWSVGGREIAPVQMAESSLDGRLHSVVWVSLVSSLGRTFCGFGERRRVLDKAKSLLESAS